MVCRICGGVELEVVYEGPIRTGKFGEVSREPHCLYQCNSCHAIFLPSVVEDVTSYYEEPRYRDEVDGSSDITDYFRIHDKEQLRHLKVTGTSIFRGKTVADVGCGGGSFLDIVSGHVKSAIAVDPSKAFSESLSKRYITYPYVDDLLRDYENKVDLAVSFSVLEHIEAPLSFLKQLYRLLSKDGKIIISTPNADDVLLQALPEAYPQFFYRKPHLWYFNSFSLAKILELAGFKGIRIIPYHRFGLANFLGWLRDKTPQGEIHMDFITPSMDAAWKAELEKTGRCDYLYAEALRE